MSETKKKQEITLATSPDFRYIYSDAININVGYYDIKLTFSSGRRTRAGEVIISDMALVVLSPQHAKEFANMMVRHVELYEQEFGPITSPSDEMAPEEVIKKADE